MNSRNMRGDGGFRSKRRRRIAISLEALEDRAVPTVAVSFTPPDLSGFIQRAQNGANTSMPTINTMVQALQTQLTSGPLAALNAGTITPTDFATEVESLVSSYQSNVDTQLSPAFPHIDTILKDQGTMIEAQLFVIGTELSSGLITSSVALGATSTAIDGLTSGPLHPLHTTRAEYVTATQFFESQLKTVAAALAPGASPSITTAQALTIGQALAGAYGDSMQASLFRHPQVNAALNNAINNLITAASTAGQNGGNVVTDLTNAFNAFDTAVLGTDGVFGTNGLLAKSAHAQ